MFKNKNGQTFDQWKMFIKIDDDIKKDNTIMYYKHGEKLPEELAKKRKDKMLSFYNDDGVAPSWIAKIFGLSAQHVNNIIKGRAK